MKVTHTIAASMLLGLLLTANLAQARDWRWYPRKAPAESDALRPDLEGTRGDDTEQSGMSELDEMRRWLQKRDEDRRQQGITVPDTVEQYEPVPDLTMHRHRWPESERVRDTLFPGSYSDQEAQDAGSAWRHKKRISSRRSKHHASGSRRHRTR